MIMSVLYNYSFLLVGPGLALNGALLPNHGILRRDPSVIGREDGGVYCVTDDVTCCGTPPSPADGDGGSGNGRGHWYYLATGELTSSTANANSYYSSWLTGAVIMSFRGNPLTGSTGLFHCDIRDSTGTLHTLYTCVYNNDIPTDCKSHWLS